MARIRLNKQRRQLRVAQKATLKEAMRRGIAMNLASPPKDELVLNKDGTLALMLKDTAGLGLGRSPTGRAMHLGFRTTPDYNQGYTFHGATNLPRMDNQGRDNSKYGTKTRGDRRK